VREFGLVIFDCDGVLVDSEPISCGVLAEHLTAAGLPTSLPQARRQYQGMLLTEVVARAESLLGRPLPPGWLETYEDDRATRFRAHLQPVPGAAAAVAQIKDSGVAVCVASQGGLAKTELTLGVTGLRHLFAEHELFSAQMVARGKPHPDLFLHAAATMTCTPANCAVVEDSPSGIAAAVAAGMHPIAYTADGDAAALGDVAGQAIGALSELAARLGLA
jgi:HAD superfamily hydrolase (TIGR01509 family)